MLCECWKLLLFVILLRYGIREDEEEDKKNGDGGGGISGFVWSHCVWNLGL